MSEWASEYLTMLDDCEEREARLSEWERGFVESLRDQIGRGRQLTSKQSTRLDEIWERVTSRPFFRGEAGA